MYIFIQCWKKSSSICTTTVLQYYLCYHQPTYGVVFSFHLQPHCFRPLESNEGIKIQRLCEGAFPPPFIFLFVSLLFFLKETFILRENTVLRTDVVFWGGSKKKNEGRSLCKVFLIRKKKPYMQTF